jgi:hypothetical protein
MSVRISPPSCSKDPARDSRALQNASVISWSSAWVHPSSLRMLSASLWVYRVIKPLRIHTEQLIYFRKIEYLIKTLFTKLPFTFI